MMTHFKAHQGIHRVSNKHFNCLICHMNFPKQSKLNEHLTEQHNTLTTEPLKCQTNNGETLPLPEGKDNLLTDIEKPGYSLPWTSLSSTSIGTSTNSKNQPEIYHYILPLPSESLEIKKEESYCSSL